MTMEALMRDAIEKAALSMKLAAGQFTIDNPGKPVTWDVLTRAAILAFLAAAEAPSDAVISDGFKAYLNARAPEEDGTRPALTYGIEAVCRAQVSALRREIESGESA